MLCTVHGGVTPLLKLQKGPLKMTDNTDKTLSRRKALTRIGGVAFAAYTIPAFTMLSVAHASSGVSASSEASDASDASDASEPSDTSTPSDASTPSGVTSPTGPSGMTAEDCFDQGGTVEYNEADDTKRCVGLPLISE